MENSIAGIWFRRLFVKIIVLLAAISVCLYIANKYYLEPMREQQRLITNLKTIVAELTKDIRVAEVFVTDQGGDPLQTTFRFVEVDENGDMLGMPKDIIITGDIAYFDTLVIKFEDTFTPEKELPLSTEVLRSYLSQKAIIFFRRIFSEKQKPEDGFVLDSQANPPWAYRTGPSISPFEQKLWSEFWEIANNPRLAADRGVRAAHGQAVYTKLQLGKHYILEQRLMGDLTIRPLELPTVLK